MKIINILNKSQSSDVHASFGNYMTILLCAYFTRCTNFGTFWQRWMRFSSFLPDYTSKPHFT